MDSTLQQLIIISVIVAYGLALFFFGYWLGARGEKKSCQKKIERMQDEVRQERVKVQTEEVELMHKKHEHQQIAQQEERRPKFKEDEKQLIAEEFGFNVR